MNKYKSLLVNSLLASIICALFQAAITTILFRRIKLSGGYPIQLLAINFAFAFIATFIPLFAFNVFIDKRTQNK